MYKTASRHSQGRRNNRYSWVEWRSGKKGKRPTRAEQRVLDRAVRQGTTPGSLQQHLQRILGHVSRADEAPPRKSLPVNRDAARAYPDGRRKMLPETTFLRKADKRSVSYPQTGYQCHLCKRYFTQAQFREHQGISGANITVSGQMNRKKKLVPIRHTVRLQ